MRDPPPSTTCRRRCDEVLQAFRTGRNSLLTSLFSPRIDRVLFAATKADHLHHTSHDRLEAVLGLLVERAKVRAAGLGASVDLAAVASVRATREARVTAGPPDTWLQSSARRWRARSSARSASTARPKPPSSRANCRPIPPKRWPQPATGEFGLRFVRFRPPMAAPASDGRPGPLPHIRLDRALEFLIGDRLT